MKACLKRLKASLALGVKNVYSPVAPIIATYIRFWDLLFFNFLDLDKFLIILLALPLPSPTN